TGAGNYAYECYSPVQMGADLTRHNHPIGGGKYWTQGWRNLSASIRAGVSMPQMLLATEHAPETLITDYILGGRSFPEPYDDSQSGVFRTIRGATPVPLIGVLYHDYDLWDAEVPNFQDVIEKYGASAGNLPLIRYRTAQLAMQGRLLSMQF